MSSDKTAIPLCHSQFLQDLTIALGRRSLKSLRRAHKILKFEVTQEEVEGVPYERLNIEAHDRLDRITKITAWEDAEFWIYSQIRTGKPLQHSATKSRANLAGLSSEYIAELIRTTLRNFESAEQTWRQHAQNSKSPPDPR